MQKNNAGPNANELALSMEGVNMGEDEDGEPISVAYANIKPGRVGGFAESRRIHDLASKAGVPVWKHQVFGDGESEWVNSA